MGCRYLACFNVNKYKRCLSFFFLFCLDLTQRHLFIIDHIYRLINVCMDNYRELIKQCGCGDFFFATFQNLD